MKKILVFCGQTAFEKLRLAADEGYELTAAESLSAEACRGYDAVLAVLPSLANGRAEAVCRLAAAAPVGIVVLVHAEDVAAAEQAFEGLGIFVAPAGLSAKQVSVLLRFAVKAGERLRLFGSETERLRGTIDDLKLIDRAKCALIQYLNMTECDAHRFIEKQAMNRRLSKREVAVEILKTYES